MDIKNYLVSEIDKREELSKHFKEKVKVEVVDDVSEGENNPEEIEIDRQTVIEYLNKSGYKLTQENYDLAERMLKNMRGKELREAIVQGDASRVQEKYKIVNHLNDMSVEELQSLLNIALLNTLNEIDNKLSDLHTKTQNIKYDYKIETIRDSGGATNVYKLSTIINNYASQGYRVVSVFTNELGKNAVSVGGIGVNSTVDQVVVIFEKPIYE